MEGDLRVLMKKNGEATEGRGSIVKCGKTLLEERGLQKPVGLSLYDGPIKTVRYIWVNIWCMLGWILTCRLLWLNLRGWGEHLTSQLIWVAAWLLATCLSCMPSRWVSPLCSWCYWRKWGRCVGVNQGWPRGWQVFTQTFHEQGCEWWLIQLMGLFFCCWGYLLLQVMVVEFEKKTCFAQPQGGEICLGSFQDF